MKKKYANEVRKVELLETMLRRRSIRTYREEDVPGEALDQILEAGLLSPSGHDLRPVALIAVEDPAVVQRLAEARASGAGMLEQASRAVVVAGDREKSDTWVEDCSLSMAYMQLRAADLGVANCWVQCRNRTARAEGVTSDEFVKSLLGIPERYSVLAILSLGLAGQEKAPHRLEELDVQRIHRGRF